MRYGLQMSVIVLAMTLLHPLPTAGAGPIFELPPPRVEGGKPLMEALTERRSIRSFSREAIDDATLSNLLWAAFGVNRPGSDGRTAPSWRGSKEIDLYLARADGVWRYDPERHLLTRFLEADIRAQTGRQPFTDEAPAVLIYIAERGRMAEAAGEVQYLYAHVDAAFISQNVYLFAASEGLATVVLGNVDKEALSALMGLGDDMILTFTQPIGHPAE